MFAVVGKIIIYFSDRLLNQIEQTVASIGNFRLPACTAAAQTSQSGQSPVLRRKHVERNQARLGHRDLVSQSSCELSRSWLNPTQVRYVIATCSALVRHRPMVHDHAELIGNTFCDFQFLAWKGDRCRQDLPARAHDQLQSEKRRSLDGVRGLGVAVTLRR